MQYKSQTQFLMAPIGTIKNKNYILLFPTPGDSNHSSYVLNITLLLCKTVQEWRVSLWHFIHVWHFTLIFPFAFPHTHCLSLWPTTFPQNSLFHFPLYFFLLSVLIFLPSFSWSSFCFLPILTHLNTKMSMYKRKYTVFIKSALFYLL